MAKSIFTRIFIVILLLFSVSLFVGCTSGEEETSVLDSEMENLDMDEDADFSDDLDDVEDGLAEIGDDELIDELDGDDADDEFGEDDEFADSEFDDEDDFGDDDFDKEFNENDEQALAKELGNSSQDQDYPEAQDPQPKFPEEVIGQQPIDPVSPMESTQPQDSVPLITSETQEIDTDIVGTVIPQDDLGKADPLIPEEELNNENQSWVPVVKIKADPFYRNERLMNAVYLARPSDTLASVSEKIYGADKTNILENDNPHLSKGMDPGDKVYYNSPNRPDDKGSLKVYYDDIGLKAQKYITNKGDNLRRLGPKLLGFPDGWKEVWAINPTIDSKTILPAGMEIRYWTGEEQPVQVQAMIEEVVPPATQGTVEDSSEMPAEEIIDAQPETVVAELPPEPPLPEASLDMADNTFEPEVLPDIEPLPEDDIGDIPGEEVAAAGSTNSGSSLITIGALALLLLGGAALVAIQIKNRKAQTEVTPPSLEYTQA